MLDGMQLLMRLFHEREYAPPVASEFSRRESCFFSLYLFFFSLIDSLEIIFLAYTHQSSLSMRCLFCGSVENFCFHESGAHLRDISHSCF